MEFPIVSTNQALEALQEVILNPDKYIIVQSETDLGLTEMQTLDKPHQYNKVFLSITFLDKSKIPGPVTI